MARSDRRIAKTELGATRSAPPRFGHPFFDARHAASHADDEELAVFHGGHAVEPVGYRIERDDFPSYGLEVVIRGHGHFESAAGSWPLSAGMVFCYGRGHAHRYYSTDPTDRLEKAWVIFSGRTAPRLLEEAMGAVAAAASLRSPAEVLTPFEALFAEGHGRTLYLQEIARHYLCIVLRKIAANRLSGHARESAGFETFLAIKEALDRDFERLLSPYELCRRLHVTPSYVCRLFARHAKPERSPYEYLLYLKLNRAAVLLSDTDALAKDIAAALGFSDLYTFSRAFKRVFGLSPQHYRDARR
jgi:AraC-like DNA-binding protein